MLPLKLDYRYLQPEISAESIAAWQPEIEAADAKLTEGTGRGSGLSRLG